MKDAIVIRVPDSTVSVVNVPGVPASGGSGGGDELNPVVDWFTGVGPPPPLLIGSGPGDMYIDIESGILYQLR